MGNVIQIYFQLTGILDRYASVIPPLLLRLVLAWEFGEAGYTKLTGSNWFDQIAFPFPFNLLPPEISWQVATWFELIGAGALLIGLATRFFSMSLMILTVVAIAAVHWPAEWSSLGQLFSGYRIVDENGDGLGNYKLPLIFLVMFLPLLFSGAGKISVDAFIRRKFG